MPEEMLEYLCSRLWPRVTCPSLPRDACIFSAGTPTAQGQAVPQHTWKYPEYSMCVGNGKLVSRPRRAGGEGGKGETASSPLSQAWSMSLEAAAMLGTVQTQRRFLPWRTGNLKRPCRRRVGWWWKYYPCLTCGDSTRVSVNDLQGGGQRLQDRSESATEATVLMSSDLHTVNGKLVIIYVLMPKDVLAFHKER